MKTEAIEFEVDGIKLRGRLFMPATPKNIACLFIHGWTGKTNEIAAELLAKHGYYSMTFSLSGHNNSDGQLEDQTIKKSLKEVLAAYDFFKKKLPTGSRVVALGNSYGGYLSILLSAQRPVACLSLRVASNYIDSDFDLPRLGRGSENPEVYKWRQLSLAPDATMALRALNKFIGPVQIIEAELDDMVPHRSTQNYVDAVKDKSELDYHFMKGWPHSLGLDKERNRIYQMLILNWLGQQL